MKNKNLLIGLGVVVVAYFLWKKSQTNSVSKTDVVTPQQSSMTQQEKTDLFNKAIQEHIGGAYPGEEFLKRLAKGREQANAKIKELKLETEFSTWLSNRPKDTGALPN